MANERFIASRPAPAPASSAAPGGPAPSKKEKGKGKSEEPRDAIREIFETVVFVVVLVLMLKTFVAEAFVIPTGSMATTLYGYQKIVTCDQCSYVFPVNCSKEIEEKRYVTGCYCPNCQHQMTWPVDGGRVLGPDWNSGDRVLVAKFLYDRDHLWSPKRGNVIVFKFPGDPGDQIRSPGPQKDHTAVNYIKRCQGEPGETVAIFSGDLYVTKSLNYHDRPVSADPLDRWQKPNMYVSDAYALAHFADSMQRSMAGKPQTGDFVIVRRPPEQMLELRRIVFDNDHQPKDLAGRRLRWSWEPNSRWTGNDPKMPKTFTYSPVGSADGVEWLTYQHLLRREILRDHYPSLERPLPGVDDERRVITNVLGYNTGFNDQNQEPIGRHWVGDLMVDCEVEVFSASGQLVLELSEGPDRFQAQFDLAGGKCRLTRQTLGKSDEIVLAEKETSMKRTGRYKLRFANFDDRLTIWVDGKLPFGDGVPYSPPEKIATPTRNDLEPARIGARGTHVAVSHLQLWRDTYYTLAGEAGIPKVTIGDSQHEIQTYYVQPGHYLALGDNSSASSDSRYFGLVPERLLLGRAVVVYFPFWPFTSDTRAGFIR